MGIGSQTLTGQDKADFLDIMRNASDSKRRDLEKKLAETAKRGHYSCGVSSCGKS